MNWSKTTFGRKNCREGILSRTKNKSRLYLPRGRGDPKTLISGPWTPLWAWSTDHCTDRSTDPHYRLPIKDNNKNTDDN